MHNIPSVLHYKQERPSLARRYISRAVLHRQINRISVVTGGRFIVYFKQPWKKRRSLSSPSIHWCNNHFNQYEKAWVVVLFLSIFGLSSFLWNHPPGQFFILSSSAGLADDQRMILCCTFQDCTTEFLDRLFPRLSSHVSPLSSYLASIATGLSMIAQLMHADVHSLSSARREETFRFVVSDLLGFAKGRVETGICIARWRFASYSFLKLGLAWPLIIFNPCNLSKLERDLSILM